MPEKSQRRLELEASLAENPRDTFLRYGLALQSLREGDIEEGRTRLIELVEQPCDEVAAACQQLGQSYLETGEFADARRYLEVGLAKAQAQGNQHAEAEIGGLLSQLG